MSVRLSCPSCNTAFALPALPDHRRAQCPRCGDVFPIHTYTEVPDDGTPDATQPAKVVHLPRKWPRVAAIGAAVALVLLGAGGWLAYRHTRDMPKSDPEPPTVAPAVVGTATPPAQLTGLGYLPAECNVVFAVQPGPLVAYAERTQQDPREVLTRTGLPQPILTALDGLGLPLGAIDHIAGGAYIGNEGDELRVALALVLKHAPPDEEEFLKKLKAKPLPGKAARWRVDLGKVPLSPILAKVSPTVWVLGLNEKDLAASENGGFGPGGTQFNEGPLPVGVGTGVTSMRGMMNAVPADAAVWVVADAAGDWTWKPLVKLAMQLAEVKTLAPALSLARGGVFAVGFGEKPRLHLVARVATENTGEQLRAYFKARAAELESATAGGKGVFAIFSAPFDPATSWPMLQRFLADARK